MEVFVCQKIGEETVYMRNLKKQASLKNNNAISLLSALQGLKSIETRLSNITKDFQMIGLQNLAILLQNLQHLAKPDFYNASAWTLCSFTGKKHLILRGADETGRCITARAQEYSTEFAQAATSTLIEASENLHLDRLKHLNT